MRKTIFFAFALAGLSSTAFPADRHIAFERNNAVYVATDGDQVVGFVHAAERTHFTGQVDAYVGELVTAPGLERRGIARALMAAAEAWGAARGLDYLTLVTGAANHGARAFYAAAGYLEEDVMLTKKIGDTA